MSRVFIFILISIGISCNNYEKVNIESIEKLWVNSTKKVEDLISSIEVKPQIVPVDTASLDSLAKINTLGVKAVSKFKEKKLNDLSSLNSKLKEILDNLNKKNQEVQRLKKRIESGVDKDHIENKLEELSSFLSNAMSKVNSIEEDIVKINSQKEVVDSNTINEDQPLKYNRGVN